MSGGQQRMVSLGMALMASPKLLMLDEPSLGLAPAVVQQIFGTVRRLADTEGLAVLLLEQNVGQALKIVDRCAVMRSGRVILEETREQMLRPRVATGSCSSGSARLEDSARCAASLRLAPPGLRPDARPHQPRALRAGAEAVAPGCHLVLVPLTSRLEALACRS